MAVEPGYRGLRQTQNRKALLASAEELFGVNGSAAITVDDIVARAGVAKGTFYNHFRDKDDIEAQIALMIRIEIRDRIAALKSDSDDPAMHIAIAANEFLRLAVERPRRAQILAALLTASADANAAMNAPLRKTLELGTSQGRFSIRSMEAAMLLVVGTVAAGIRNLTERNAPTSHAAIPDLVVHILMGLGLQDFEAAKQIAGWVASQSRPQ
jgi:AcrR family transcriptional regulator